MYSVEIINKPYRLIRDCQFAEMNSEALMEKWLSVRENSYNWNRTWHDLNFLKDDIILVLKTIRKDNTKGVIQMIYKGCFRHIVAVNFAAKSTDFLYNSAYFKEIT